MAWNLYDTSVFFNGDRVTSHLEPNDEGTVEKRKECDWEVIYVHWDSGKIDCYYPHQLKLINGDRSKGGEN